MTTRHHRQNSKMPLPICKSLAFTMLLMALAPASFAADLYRWVDNKGEVHYTDRVPPEYVQNGYRVINKQGLTITTIAPKKDEPAADKKIMDDEGKAQLERDKRLLTTYASANEIIAARDRKIAEIKSNISLRKETLSLLEKQFREQTREAGDYEKQGEAVPETLRANINTTKKKISSYEEAIKQLQQQLPDTQKQFNDELARYKQITQAMEQKQQPAK